MTQKDKHSLSNIVTWISRIVGIGSWGILLVLCFLYRKEFTVDGILQYTPSNPMGAACVLILLFGLKSLTMFLYSGILYAASGVIFPFPLALGVSVLGTIVMATIPYAIGRNLGSDAVERLSAEYPKLQTMREFQGENELLLTVFIRMVGLIPGDLAAMYSGANHAKYGDFLTGTLLGMIPMIVLFGIMGMSADNPTSPVFLFSVVMKIVLAFISAAWFSRWRKRRKMLKNQEFTT